MQIGTLNQSSKLMILALFQQDPSAFIPTEIKWKANHSIDGFYLIRSRLVWVRSNLFCLINDLLDLIWWNIPPGSFISFSARNPVKFEFLIRFHFLDLSFDVWQIFSGTSILSKTLSLWVGPIMFPKSARKVICDVYPCIMANRTFKENKNEFR